MEKIMVAWLIEQVDKNIRSVYVIAIPPVTYANYSNAKLTRTFPPYDITRILPNFDESKFYIMARSDGEVIEGFPRNGVQLFDSKEGYLAMLTTVQKDFDKYPIDVKYQSKLKKFLTKEISQCEAKNIKKI